MRRGRVIGAVVGAIVLAGAAGLYGVHASEAPDLQVAAVFDNTVGVYTGSDVRVLGVRVGQIDAIVPEGQSVKVTMSVDPSVRIAQDSTAVAIAPSLVSDRYIQLAPAKRGAPTLASGTTIARDHTATPVELDQVYAALEDLTTSLGPNGANKTGALSKLITTGAKNLKGNGADINSTITDFGAAAKTLENSQTNLFGTVNNLKTFNDTLAADDQGVAQVNSQLAAVSGYLADDRQDYAAAVSQLTSALALVQGFIKDNRGAITADVNGLQSTVQTLSTQKAQLDKITSSIPVALQNFLDAYDAEHGTLDVRGNLNELGVWAGSSSSASSTSSTSSAAPAAKGTAGSSGSVTLPMFLPSSTGGGR